MSFDKSIQSGKEHRKPYRGAKSIDSTCRNHGSCEWCEGNRTHKNAKRELSAEQELKEYDGTRNQYGGTMTFDVIDPKTGKYPDLEHIARTEEWA